MKTTDTLDFNLLQILWRRRLIIGVALVLGMALVLWNYSRAPRIYEAKATVGIGKTILLGEEKSRFVDLESPDVLAARFLARHRAGSEGAWLAEAKAEKLPDISSLTLTARGKSAGEASALLKTIVQSIVVSHQERYDEVLKKLKSRYEKNQARLDLVRGDFDQSITGSVAKLRAGDVGKTLAEALRPWSISNLSTLEEKQAAIETVIASGVIRPTELFGDVAAPSSPVEPRAKAHLGGGTVLVLLFAFFSALFLELVSRLRVSPPATKRSLSEA